MRTNIIIDDQLMADAKRIFGTRTKRDTLDAALREAIKIKQQEALMDLWGMGWEGDLNEMRTNKYIPLDL